MPYVIRWHTPFLWHLLDSQVSHVESRPNPCIAFIRFLSVGATAKNELESSK